MLRVCFIFLLVIGAKAQAQDPAIKSDTPAVTIPVKIKPSTRKDTPPAYNKYSFSTMGGVKKSPAFGGALPSFQTQNGLAFNMHPQANSFVQSYRQRNGPGLIRMKSWGASYFSSMEYILSQYGIPPQLKYLAVIETNLDNSSVSWTGAAGIWQFMPQTAREYGLVVNGYTDDRFNIYKSTHAAARYLRDMYIKLKDWLLVVAAYNGGPGRVYSAISRSGSRNFWDLQYFLPLESSNHVKKFIATHMIMEGNTNLPGGLSPSTMPQKFFNPLEASGMGPDTATNFASEKITGRYNSLVIAKYTLMNITSFNRMNPGFDQALSSSESEFDLRLPEDKMQLFRANRLQIMNESLQLFLSTSVPVQDLPVLDRSKGRRKTNSKN
jgi:membrane-bound lytic murein transglycosylase D